jgi:hypothetical protein
MSCGCCIEAACIAHTCNNCALCWQCELALQSTRRDQRSQQRMAVMAAHTVVTRSAATLLRAQSISALVAV